MECDLPFSIKIVFHKDLEFMFYVSKVNTIKFTHLLNI